MNLLYSLKSRRWRDGGARILLILARFILISFCILAGNPAGMIFLTISRAPAGVVIPGGAATNEVNHV